MYVCMYVTCTYPCMYNDTFIAHTCINIYIYNYTYVGGYTHKYNYKLYYSIITCFFKAATQPKVTVQAIININIDLKEISEDRANRLLAMIKSRQYTTAEELVTINQELYLQSTGRRLFIVDSISTEMYERLRSINSIHSRTLNNSRENVVREMIRSFIDQLHYDEIHSNGSTDGESQWLARLLMQHSTMGYIPLDVPVTGVLITFRYQLNCKYLSLKCARYVTQ